MELTAKTKSLATNTLSAISIAKNRYSFFNSEFTAKEKQALNCAEELLKEIIDETDYFPNK